MGGQRYLKTINIKSALVTSLFFALSFFFIKNIVGKNRFIYYWDYGGYWTLSYNFTKSLFNNPMQAVRELYESICNDDYNKLLPFIISYPLKIIGYSFRKYILICTLVFLFPASIITSVLIAKLLDGSNIKYNFNILFPLANFLFLSFSPVLVPLMIGYIDVACLIPAALLLIGLLEQRNIISKSKIVIFFNSFIVSYLCIEVVLFRRYFAYFILGWGIALIIDGLFDTIHIYKYNKAKIFNWLYNFVLIGLIGVIILTLPLKRFTYRIIASNYQRMYSAYDLPLNQKISTLIGIYGKISIFLIILSFVLFWKYSKAREYCLELVAINVISAGCFMTVQNFGHQHALIVAIQTFVMEVAGIIRSLFIIRKDNKVRSLIIYPIEGVVIFLYVCNFTHCYYYFPANYISDAFSYSYTPLIRNDIQELQNLKNYLNELTATTDDMVYVCSSGSVLNDSIMFSLDKPNTDYAVNNMTWSSHVDLRDGFPTQFLKSNIVVVTDPIELHLAEGTQEVVRWLAQEVMDRNSPIGRHFNKERSFTLDNNVSAIVYIKNDAYTADDIQYIKNYYCQIYPDNKELFEDKIYLDDK